MILGFERFVSILDWMLPTKWGYFIEKSPNICTLWAWWKQSKSFKTWGTKISLLLFAFLFITSGIMARRNHDRCDSLRLQQHRQRFQRTQDAGFGSCEINYNANGQSPCWTDQSGFLPSTISKWQLLSAFRDIASGTSRRSRKQPSDLFLLKDVLRKSRPITTWSTSAWWRAFRYVSALRIHSRRSFICTVQRLHSSHEISKTTPKNAAHDLFWDRPGKRRLHWFVYRHWNRKRVSSIVMANLLLYGKANSLDAVRGIHPWIRRFMRKTAIILTGTKPTTWAKR